MSLCEGAVKKPITTSLCFLAVAVFGLPSLPKPPIDLYPDIDTNMIMVMTACPGASASSIESSVTRPLENVSNSVSDLKHITLRSLENMSLIILEFELGSDIDMLTNDVRGELDMVSLELPDDTEGPIIFKFSTDMIPIVLSSVQANESQSALYKTLDDRVVNPLARIPGVGTVSIGDAPQREIRVYCDPYKLEAYNLSIETISSITRAENGNVPDDNFDIGNETYSLHVKGEFDDSGKLANVVVGTYNGTTVYLCGVAKTVDTVEERAWKTCNNGVQGVVIVVQKQLGASSVEISKRVQDALPRLQKNLPNGAKLGVIVDTSENILNTIDSLTETVMYVLLFVVIVVSLLLRRRRAVLIICITILLSLIASFIYLAISENTINIISPSSLSTATGMVVDDTIVVLENIATHIEYGSDPKQTSAYDTNKVTISTVASTLTMIAVFFPLAMVTDMSGVLLRRLGRMMCAVMPVSTVSALTLTPISCSQLLRLQRKQSKAFQISFGPVEHALDRLDNRCVRTLNQAVRHRMMVLAGCVTFFILSLLCAKTVGTELSPAQSNARIAVQLELPIGTRKEATQKVSEKPAKQRLEKHEGIMKTCNYTVGQAGSDSTWASTQNDGLRIISFNVSLVDPDERNVTLETVYDEMREDLKAYPGFSKAQVIFGGSNMDMSAQASADFEVYGYSMEEADSVAVHLKCRLLRVKGVSEVNINHSDYQSEYQVDFDCEKLALHGLNLSTAVAYLRNRTNGATASKYREDGDEYDIKVRCAPEYRTSLESTENTLVYNAKGEGVCIRDLGKVVKRFTSPTIGRKDRERIVAISAVISGAPLGDVVAAGNMAIDELEKSSDITIQVSGFPEDQRDSFRDLGTLGVLTIVLVFIVMATQPESLTYPFILTLSVPFVMSGVLMVLFTTNTTLNVMGLLDSIALISIVVKNGIVLVDYTILCRERGQSVLSVVVMADESRLRPMLMTTMITILSMTPTAASTGQDSEVWSPMAIAVIGDLAVSTILILVYVPTIYCIFGGVGIERQRRKIHKQLDIHFEEQKQTNN